MNWESGAPFPGSGAPGRTEPHIGTAPRGSGQAPPRSAGRGARRAPARPSTTGRTRTSPAASPRLPGRQHLPGAAMVRGWRGRGRSPSLTSAVNQGGASSAAAPSPTAPDPALDPAQDTAPGSSRPRLPPAAPPAEPGTGLLLPSPARPCAALPVPGGTFPKEGNCLFQPRKQRYNEEKLCYSDSGLEKPGAIVVGKNKQYLLYTHP